MKPSFDNVPEIVRRYFELDAERDVEGILALFSDDATRDQRRRSALRERRDPRMADRCRLQVGVHDDDHEQRGARRRSLPSERSAGGQLPGATVDLNHDFTIATGLI
jgi:ketosteroid isomerase-like protein